MSINRYYFQCHIFIHTTLKIYMPYTFRQLEKRLTKFHSISIRVSQFGGLCCVQRQDFTPGLSQCHRCQSKSHTQRSKRISDEIHHQAEFWPVFVNDFLSWVTNHKVICMERILHYFPIGLQLSMTWQTAIKLTTHLSSQQLPQPVAMRGTWTSLLPLQVKADSNERFTSNSLLSVLLFTKKSPLETVIDLQFNVSCRIITT